MSSLAGALDQPTSYNHAFATDLPPVSQEGLTDEDVDMNPASDIPPKEEENTTTTISTVMAHDDEEMEDLFGNELDDAKPDGADTKSDR